MAIQALPPAETSPPPVRRRWTVDEAATISELLPGERFELLEGDLYSKMGQKPPHVHILRFLASLLSRASGPERVQIRSSIRLPDPEGRYSEPEPDIVLLRPESVNLLDRLATPEDIAQLIEVADMSFELDRTLKYKLYAKAAVREYWIVDIPRQRTVVCREPMCDEYKSVAIFESHEAVVPVEMPNFVFAFDALLKLGNQ
jgi:Uma2 family endonuclease